MKLIFQIFACLLALSQAKCGSALQLKLGQADTGSDTEEPSSNSLDSSTSADGNVLGKDGATPSTGSGSAGGSGSIEAAETSKSAPTSAADPAAQGCPKYPLVFHHGFMGSKKMGAFVGVEEQFGQRGCKVLVTEVAAVQTSEYRGEQLKQQIQAFLAQTGATKVHIIAHSQGGLDARYAISKLGLADSVASLSTLSTPHHGTKLADIALNTNMPMAKTIMVAFMNMMGKTMNGNTPDPDTLAAVKSMTVDYVENTFNPQVPNVPGVLYQSWGAQTGPGTTDQTKLMLKLPNILLRPDGPNDGVVETTSAQWGEVRGVLDADHLDLIGMKALDFGSPFDHHKFLDTLVDELKTKGL